MTSSSGPIAYAAVVDQPDDDKRDTLTAHAFATPESAFVFSVSPRYAHLPEAASLTWSDDYFEENSGSFDRNSIVAVFDFDYEAMEAFYTKVGWTCYGASACCIPSLFWWSLVALVPCHLSKNVGWTQRCQHIAITRDGIRYVRAQHPTCWGNRCSDFGKRVKTIPFHHITDCELVEPAGNTCVWIPNTLFEINISTSTPMGDERVTLQLAGLKEPRAFCDLLWAMKRASPTGTMPMDRCVGPSAPSNAEVVSMLHGIRQDLQQQNTSTGQAVNEAITSAPTAHVEIV